MSWWFAEKLPQRVGVFAGHTQTTTFTSTWGKEFMRKNEHNWQEDMMICCGFFWGGENGWVIFQTPRSLELRLFAKCEELSSFKEQLKQYKSGLGASEWVFFAKMASLKQLSHEEKPGGLRYWHWGYPYFWKHPYTPRVWNTTPLCGDYHIPL